MLREGRKIFLKRGPVGVFVHRDEDHSFQPFDLDPRQGHRLAVDMRKVPSLRNRLKISLQRPTEAVIRAADYVARLWAVAQPAAAMQAGVDISADFVRSGADDNDRIFADLEVEAVADLREILILTGVKPL